MPSDTVMIPAELLEERPAPPIGAKGPLYFAVAYYLPGKFWSQKCRMTARREDAERALDQLSELWAFRRIYRIGALDNAVNGKPAPTIEKGGA